MSLNPPLKSLLAIAALILATTGVSPLAAQRGEQQTPKPTADHSADSAQLVSHDEVEKMKAEVSRRIAPFQLADAADGFKNELNSKANALKSTFGAGAITSATMARPRPQPQSGRTSVEVFSKDGKLDTIAFKTLKDNAGFSGIWGAKPVVVLSNPTAVDTSSGIGFKNVILVANDTATEYVLIGSNSWSVNTHPYK